MSRKSDVSKMLVSHSGRSGSTVGSAVGRGRQKGSDTGSTNSARPTTSPGAPAPAAANKGKSYGFLLMKCLDVLKKKDVPMHVQELQVALGAEFHVSDREFLSRLRANPRVRFDSTTKRWSYVSPYSFLTSQAALLAHIKEKKSFEVNLEVVDFNKEVVSWLTNILNQRLVRAIRGTKISRCKSFTSESGLYCNLYEPESRCDGCKTFQGVFLYQRGAEYLEDIELDDDYRKLWHKIENTPVAGVDALMGGKKRNPTGGETQGRNKRKKPSGPRAPRVSKIVNVHMYSAEEFKEALEAEAAAEAKAS